MAAKATGWSREEIMSLPFAQVLLLTSAYMVSEGGALQWMIPDPAEQELLKKELEL